MISPAASEPLGDPTLQQYLMNLQRSDWGELLAPFSPPVPGAGEVMLASLFGDVFLELGGGEIWWVNAQMNEVTTVAPSREAFEPLLQAEHGVYLGSTKTKRGVRTIVLPPDVVASLPPAPP